MKRSACLIASVIGLLLLFHSNSALAIYTWTDEKGTMHISDYPPPKSPVEATSAEPEEVKNKEKAQPAASAASEQTRKSVPPKAAGSTTQQPSIAAAPVSEPIKSGQSVTLPMLQQQRPDVPSTAATTSFVAPPQTAESTTVPQNMPFNQNTQANAAQNIAVIAAVKKIISMFFTFLVIGYIYFSVCLFMIARKLNVSGAWVAFVPILQILTFLSSASKPAWWILLFFVPVVNVIIPIYLWICISENLGRDKWLGLLMVVPIVNLVYLGMLAFSNQGSGSNNVDVATS